jgi:hypothetical protein
MSQKQCRVAQPPYAVPAVFSSLKWLPGHASITAVANTCGIPACCVASSVLQFLCSIPVTICPCCNVVAPLQILTPLHVRALATVIPPLERMRDWGLSYSTRVHGISLATLYR